MAADPKAVWVPIRNEFEVDEESTESFVSRLRETANMEGAIAFGWYGDTILVYEQGSHTIWQHHVSPRKDRH